MGVGLHLNEGEYHLLIAGDIDPMEVEEDLHLNGGGDHLLIAGDKDLHCTGEASVRRVMKKIQIFFFSSLCM